ncbi:synapse differentiation-inducing gene protein 1-like isoform X2 [Oryzias melastigma]|nr:synapse differentiation-inducing gene protein 1-like isoform X2 [Oryzias melastigma]
MVYNPLPPPYQETPLQEPPPLQAFGNFAGAGYDPPDFVTVQPIPYMDEVQRTPVKDYLGYSIFTTLCCCLPIGMAALVQSVITREANFYGNWMRAKKRSKKALILNNLALGAGLFIITSVLVFFLWIACLRY